MPNSRGDFVLANDGVAEQAADDGAAQAVVFAQAVAAHGGDAAPLDGFGVARQLAIVLRVGGSDAADGADAHAVKIGAGLGGVALKIAMQRAIALGDGEFVVGFGEVVHADVLVAGAAGISRGRCRRCGISPCPRADASAKRALLLAQPGHVRVAEQATRSGASVST